MRDQASYSRGRLKSSVGGRLFFLIPGKSYIFLTSRPDQLLKYPSIQRLLLWSTIFSYPNTGIDYPKIKESFFMIFFSVRCIMRQFRRTLFEKKIVYISQTSSPPPLPHHLSIPITSFTCLIPFGIVKSQPLFHNPGNMLNGHKMFLVMNPDKALLWAQGSFTRTLTLYSWETGKTGKVSRAF